MISANGHRHALFILLGDDRASQAFQRFERQVQAASRAVDRHNSALARQENAARFAARGLTALNLATGVLEPALAGATVAVAGLSSALAAAGAGAGAYGIALKPVLSQVGNLMKLQDAAAAGSKTSQAQLQATLRSTPPVVAAFARSVEGARSAYTAWGNSLAAPVLAPLQKALTFVQPVLRAMTPLARAAAGAFGTLVAELGARVQGGGLERFVRAVLPAVRPAILNLGHAIGNVTAGIWGIVRAFLPVAGQIGAGVVRLTAAFKRWGLSLPSHSGFQSLMRMFRQQAPLAGQVLRNLAAILKNVTSALAGMTTPANSRLFLQLLVPLTAVMAKLSANQGLVQTVSMFLLFRKILGPFTPMLSMFGKSVGIIRSGTTLWAGAQRLLNLAMAANPVGLVITLLAALGAALYLAWTRSATFRRILISAWNAIKGTAMAVVGWFSGPFVRFFTVTIPHTFGLVLSWVKRNWPWLAGALAGPVGLAVVWIIKHWGTLIRGIRSGWNTVIGFIRRIPGWILGALAGFGKLLWQKGWDLLTGLWHGITRAWAGTGRWIAGLGGWIVSQFAKAGTWLTDAGKKVIGGLASGIGSVLSDAVGWVKTHIWDPIWRAIKRILHIGPSNSAVFYGLGTHLMASLGRGLVANAPAVARRVISLLGGQIGRLLGKIPGLIGVSPNPAAPAQLYARGLLQQIYGAQRALGEYVSLWKLWMGESGWRWNATNPYSGAYGIPQALPGSKMASAGADWRTNPLTQIRWGLAYIWSRYGTPSAAYAAWSRRQPHWYGSGGLIPETVLGMGAVSGTRYGFHAGETVIPAGGAREVHYHISVSVPLGVSGAAVGREIVERIRDFERGSGKGWRLR